MQLHSDSFRHLEPIPDQYAFGVPTTGEMRHGGNRNPHLRWRGAPEGTRSFVVLCIDTDVPTRFEDANQPGRSLPRDMPRRDFTHWVMIDVPAGTTEIAAGSCSDGIVEGGKQSPRGPSGSRQGRNDYGDADAAWYGYDGPCPPFNDERLHHYHFHVHALDVDRLDVPDDFGLDEVKQAMQDHILASATLTGTYTRNTRL
ncbi:YbhB/YbcL family Raf kinase inhibitor-like protein [Dokdonella sp.]|uniref:YbhB/YbcL family Raf kinase inhibitor-like protein n=1 Tax=Dokdonella sp. TaxID=2291710 RepID=UPI0031C89E1B|nr:YbhB/YbcL family Raf kinase inhibitor-like protein [Dokdonella sp.]